MHSYYSFKQARKVVRKQKLINTTQWRDYCKSSGFDPRIPTTADRFYRRHGGQWTDWYDFLGNSSDRRKYMVNDNYFKKWSHNMAYIFGFWFADGHIRKTVDNGYYFVITQHGKDKYLMEQILKEMGSDAPLQKHGDNAFNLVINSRQIVENIIRLGGGYRKSLTCRFPNIPRKYLPDFIRGLFDGDGSVNSDRKTKNGRNIGYSSSMTSGSKKFIYELKTVLEKNIDGIKISTHRGYVKKGDPCRRDHKDGTYTIDHYKKNCIVYSLKLSSNSTRMLRDFMYDGDNDEFKMKRKYDKFVDAGDYRICGRDIKYLTYRQAKQAIKNKGFRTMPDYLRWLKGGSCKLSLPASPHTVYKKEWKGPKDFLGNQRLPYQKLCAIVRKHGIVNRRQYHAWTVKMKKKRGQNAWHYPRHPFYMYEEWSGWNNFLGTQSRKRFEITSKAV